MKLHFVSYGSKTDLKENVFVSLICSKLHAYCADISGERIWVEVKKIAVGRFADNMFSVMAELGVLRHLG